MRTTAITLAAMPYSVGDHVNVLAPFDQAMPPIDGGYRIVAVNSYVDGITGEPGQTCTIANDANLYDFAGHYLEAYTPPE